MTDFIIPGIFSIIDIAFHKGQTINIVSPNIKHENRNCKMYVEIRLGQNMTENYEYARSVIETKQGNTAEFEMHFPLISKLKIQLRMLYLSRAYFVYLLSETERH